MTPNARPRCTASQISTQQVGHELLIYDERRHQAFCLNVTSAAVWKLCDGRRTLTQIADAARTDGMAGVTEDVVLLAVNQLHADGLVEYETPWMPIPEMSRRVLVQRLATGALILLPAVATVMAPKAAQAYNGCVDCSAANGKTTQEKRRKWQQTHPAKPTPMEIPKSSPDPTNLFKP